MRVNPSVKIYAPEEAGPSSANNDHAVALYDWLQREGWRDAVFLDLDPIRGIFA